MTSIVTRYTLALAAVATLVSSARAGDDSKRTLKAGEEGTTLESVTVEGEDRVNIDFARPELVLNVDPFKAPGLEWDVVWSLLAPEALDLYAPLPPRTREIRSPYRLRTWADEFRRDDVARFRPQLEGVASWQFVIADAKGQEVAKFGGKGSPPEVLSWSGKTTAGGYALPGRRYSFAMEAADRAGNRRNFVGEGFQVPAYAVEIKGGVVLLMSRSDLQKGSKEGPAAPVLYAATRINQMPVSSPVVVTVAASNYKSGEALAKSVAGQIRDLALGADSRVSTHVKVEQGLDDPAVEIRVGSAVAEASN